MHTHIKYLIIIVTQEASDEIKNKEPCVANLWRV